MRRFFGGRTVFGAVLVFAVLTFVAAAGADGLHGIGLSKGCISAAGKPPGVTRVGQAYTCNYNIVNSSAIDTSLDTLTISSLVDTIATSPVTTSGNIIHDGQLVASGGATCTGGTGSGTIADPYINSTGCSLPSG